MFGNNVLVSILNASQKYMDENFKISSNLSEKIRILGNSQKDLKISDSLQKNQFKKKEMYF